MTDEEGNFRHLWYYFIVSLSLSQILCSTRNNNLCKFRNIFSIERKEERRLMYSRQQYKDHTMECNSSRIMLNAFLSNTSITTQRQGERTMKCSNCKEIQGQRQWHGRMAETSASTEEEEEVFQYLMEFSEKFIQSGWSSNISSIHTLHVQLYVCTYIVQYRKMLSFFLFTTFLSFIFRKSISILTLNFLTGKFSRQFFSLLSSFPTVFYISLI